MAVLRLQSGMKNNNQVVMFDYTWWLPEVMIFSCLEVDFAIIAASMPIFWPSVMAAWTKIYVTHEVIVIAETRDSDNKGDLEMASIASRKSIDSTGDLILRDDLEDRAALTVVQVQSGKDMERKSWGDSSVRIHI
jgi:hypothetical protein